MVKIISDAPKKKVGKRFVIGVVVIIVLLAGGVAAWYVATHQPTTPSKTTSNTNGTTKVTTQSDAVQKASETAATQASSGNTKGAIQTLGDAASSTSDQGQKADLYSQQAALYAQSGNNDAAVASSKQAIEANPTDWKNYANLGFIYKSMGDKNNALSYFNQALTVMKQQGDTSGQSEIQGAINQLGAS